MCGSNLNYYAQANQLKEIHIIRLTWLRSIIEKLHIRGGSHSFKGGWFMTLLPYWVQADILKTGKHRLN